MPNTVPSGNYPKMVTTTDASGRVVPTVFPAGDANQFNFCILNNSTEEVQFNTMTGRFTNSPVAISTVSGPTHGNGNGWTSGGWKK